MINRLAWVTLGAFIFIICTTATVSAVSIGFGQTLSGSLSAAGTDIYTFTGNEKDKIIIRISRTSGTFQPLAEPQGRCSQE